MTRLWRRFLDWPYTPGALLVATVVLLAVSATLQSCGV